MKLLVKTLRDEVKEIISKCIEGNIDDEIIGIVEINAALWGTSYKGIRVISPFEAINRYKNGECDGIVLPGVHISEDIMNGYYREVIGMGYKSSDVYFISVENMFESASKFIKYDSYNYIDYLEFHTNDHCNLNCKNCNNFSNYVSGEKFTDLEQLKKDILQLKKFVAHIRTIRILGGEPLLNPQLVEYIKFIRESFKYSEIHLVTNAILYKRIEGGLEEIIRQTGTTVEISGYPVMFDKIDEVANYLKAKGINIRIGWIANGFRPPIIERYGYPLESVDCNCVHLRNGKLARCPIAQYIDYYNEANNTNYTNEDALVDLYEKGMNFNRLHAKLGKAFDLCNYCGFWRRDLPEEKWAVERRC